MKHGITSVFQVHCTASAGHTPCKVCTVRTYGSTGSEQLAQYIALLHSCRTFRRTFGFRASAGESADVNAPHGNWAMDAMGSMGHTRGHGGAQPHEHAHEAQQLGHELGASAMNERKAREATCGVHTRAATRAPPHAHRVVGRGNEPPRALGGARGRREGEH